MNVPSGRPGLVGKHPIAAPSWVISDTLAANCRFLDGKIHEVGLLFFETASCLAYTEADLPRDLASLDLAWHVHLPLDLPWDTPERVADACLSLMDSVAYLGVQRAVLHPPQAGITIRSLRACDSDAGIGGGQTASFGQEDSEEAGRALEIFAHRWQAAGRLMADCLLENVHGADLVDIWPAVCNLGYSVCLDTGHVISYRQYGLLELPGLRERVRMVHVNAPGPRGKHMPLTSLTPEGYGTVARMLQLAPDDAVIMMEIFEWAGIAASLPLVTDMLGREGRRDDSVGSGWR